ncbi:MAG TPA: DUF167 domain-containing protein [Mycobacterium sp.]|nr:DUF167 domain-containing protein [Mycobacterium sp.]HNM85541.1 DUF167 domain-containing protein [Mycobacterium sp.]
MAEFVTVRVKPGSRKGPLVEVGPDGDLTIYVRERAVDGKANEAVIRLLADHLDVSRSQLVLASGATSRHKRFRIG